MRSTGFIGMVAASAALALGLAAGAASGQVKISQFHGSGNAVGGTYQADYVELFNSGTVAVNLAGWSLHTSSITTASSAWHKTNLAGTIEPGHYFLFQTHATASGARGIPITPTPDQMSTLTESAAGLDVSQTFAGIALISDTTTTLAAGCPLPLSGHPEIVDFVRAYSATTNPELCVHGTANAPGQPTFSDAVFRKNGGCTDTEDDGADFEAATAAPRNSAYNGFLSAAFAPSVVTSGLGGNVTLTVSRSSIPCNGLAALTGVTANLSALGGSGSQALASDGMGNYSFTQAVSGAQAAGTYTVTITATTASGSATTAAAVRVRVAPPVNDVCEGAYDMNALGLFNGTFDNTTAETDMDTGPCALNGLTGGGVWFKYTPAQDEILTMMETGTQDVNYGVFTGSCGSLSYLDCLSGEGNEANPQARIRVLAGVTHYILVGQQAGYTPTVPMQLSFAATAASAPPANDTCATAQAITFPFNGTVDADNARDDATVPTCATSFSGVNFARHGVWYSFTATGPGRLMLSETGPANNPAYALYSGGCGGLTQLACASSAMEVPGAGTYFLQVYQNNHGIAPNGAYLFDWQFVETPGNDECAGAQDISSSAFPIQIVQSIYSAHDDADVSCNADTASFGRAVWFKMTAASDGVFKMSNMNQGTGSIVYAWYDTCGGPAVGCGNTSTTTYVAMTTGQTYYIAVGEWLRTSGERTDPIRFDVDFFPASTNVDCASEVDLTTATLPLTATYNQQNAGTLPSFPPCRSANPGRKALYFKYTSTIHGRFRMSAVGDSPAAYYRVQRQIGPNPCTEPADLEDYACNDASPYRINFSVDPGQTYHIIVADATPNGWPTVEPHRLLIEAQASESANDTCQTAINLTGATFPVHQTFADVRFFTDSPDVACNTSGAAKVWHGTWFSYTPATDVAVTVGELISGTNVVMAVYDACDGTALQCSTPEENYYELNAGQNYKLLVGYDSTTAGFTTALPMDIWIYAHERVTHDLCSNARQIMGFPYSAVTNLIPATADAPAANQTGCNTASATVMQSSVWYKLVVTGSGQLTGTINHDLFGNKTGVWAVYNSVGGECPTSGAPLACGVDGTNTPANVNAALSAGNTYYLQVGRSGTSASTAGSIVQLDLQFSGAVQGGVCCRGATCTLGLSQGQCTATGAAGAMFSTGSSVCNSGPVSNSPCCYANYNKVNGVSVQDIFDFLSDWFGGIPYARVGADGTPGPLGVQSIFDFLSDWFAGGCS